MGGTKRLMKIFLGPPDIESKPEWQKITWKANYISLYCVHHLISIVMLPETSPILGCHAIDYDWLIVIQRLQAVMRLFSKRACPFLFNSHVRNHTADDWILANLLTELQKIGNYVPFKKITEIFLQGSLIWPPTHHAFKWVQNRLVNLQNYTEE